MLIRRPLDKKVLQSFDLFLDILLYKNNPIYSFFFPAFTLNVHLQMVQLNAASFPASPLCTLSSCFFCSCHKKICDSEKIKMDIYYITLQYKIIIAFPTEWWAQIKASQPVPLITYISVSFQATGVAVPNFSTAGNSAPTLPWLLLSWKDTAGFYHQRDISIKSVTMQLI